MSTSESKGSPPSWGRVRIGGGWVVTNSEGRIIAEMVDGPSDSVSGPNAALIAKAPDMAAMLRELEGVANEEYGRIQCPVCDSMWDHSDTATYHKPDCRLNALLRSLP